jgi:hypothetical protein
MTLIEKWNGAVWATAVSTNTSTQENQLYGVALSTLVFSKAGGQELVYAGPYVTLIERGP